MTVGELDKRISARELREWMVYEGLTGSLSTRARIDRNAAVVASANANIWREKHQKPAKITDYIPRYDIEDAEGESE